MSGQTVLSGFRRFSTCRPALPKPCWTGRRRMQAGDRSDVEQGSSRRPSGLVMTPGTGHRSVEQRRKAGWWGLRLVGWIVFLVATARFVRIALLVEEHGPAGLAGPLYFVSLPAAGLLGVSLTGIYRRSRTTGADERQRKQAELTFGVGAALLLISFWYEMMAGHVP
jgi:hypothetical protein